MLQRQYQLGTIETSPVFIKLSGWVVRILVQMVKEFTTIDELHDQVEAELVLEGIV